jgi:ribosomal protein S18 acetylase RimI-like enzyme
VRPAIRPLTASDGAHVRWALWTALSWNPERPLPPPEVILEHPEAVRYHRDWGRYGDLGVLAERDGEVVGVAYCRLFTDEDHGHGFVDERTPELAIAVHADERGAGLGARLLDELASLARSEGFEQLSLSVDTENPAALLYERLGYRDAVADEGGRRMVLELR